MRKLTIAALIVGIALVALLAGCGGGGGGTNGGTNPPPTSGPLVITGKVMDNRKDGNGNSVSQPVALVSVSLNGQTVQTGADGTFKFPQPAALSTLLSMTDAYFYVSTRLASQSDYPVILGVIYNGVTYPQDITFGAKIQIPLAAYVATSGTQDLGTITVKFNDPTQPPSPPDLP